MTPSGSVARKLSDGTRQLLMRDGNVGEYKTEGPYAGCWVTANGAGLRMGTTAAGDAFYVPPLSVASSTDPVTHNVVTTRSDGTLVLNRADRSRVVQFADGTCIESTAEACASKHRGDVTVTCPGCAPVAISIRLSEVTVHGLDGTDLHAGGGSVSLSHRGGTHLTLSSAGALELVPAAVHWKGVDDARSGTYAVDLATGTVYTKDPEGSEFKVQLGAGGISTNLVMKDELAEAAEEQAGITKNPDDDDPDWSHPPRLFVLRPDGSGAELLRESDVVGFRKQREADVKAGTCILLQEPLPAEASAKSLTYTWRDWRQLEAAAMVKQIDESDATTQLAFIPKAIPKPPKESLVRFRRLVHRPPLSAADRQILEREISQMNEFRLQEEERATEMHVVDGRSDEEKAAELDIQRELLEVFPGMGPGGEVPTVGG